MKFRTLVLLLTVLLLAVSTIAIGAEKPLVIAFRGDAATMDPHLRSETTTMDDVKREKLRHAIMADAMASYYVVPLYYQENVNGYGNRVKGKARVDEYIYAYEIKKAK